MEVNVDSDRILAERSRRAWSQDHLAQAAGVGLRTVQRIEKTGKASHESIKSLASALSLSVVDLQPEVVGIPRGQPGPGLSLQFQLTRSLPIRAGLLVIAGMVPAFYIKRQLGLGAAWDVLFSIVLPAAILFGVLVWSHRKFGTHLVPRAIAFVGVSALSFVFASSFFVYVPPA